SEVTGWWNAGRGGTAEEPRQLGDGVPGAGPALGRVLAEAAGEPGVEPGGEQRRALAGAARGGLVLAEGGLDGELGERGRVPVLAAGDAEEELVRDEDHRPDGRRGG